MGITGAALMRHRREAHQTSIRVAVPSWRKRKGHRNARPCVPCSGLFGEFGLSVIGMGKPREENAAGIGIRVPYKSILPADFDGCQQARFGDGS